MEKAPPAYKPHIRELASRIYVQLVSSATSVSEKGVKMAASAENLSRLSFQLAEAFQTVEDQLNADNMPKNAGFRPGVDDIALWTK
jgi:hypothetical protein